MSQYQMHPRNATLWRFILALLIAWICLVTLSPRGNVAAISPAQNGQAEQSHLLLLPLGDTPVELLTHTVDVTVSVEGDLSLRMDLMADYRFHNPKTVDNTLLLQIVNPPGAPQAAFELPQALSLENNGQPLALQPTGNGLQQTAQLSFGPDGRRTLRLRYSLRFATRDLPAFVYPIGALDGWPGQVSSWRVTLNFADSGDGLLSSDNWLAVEPERWTYNGSRLQWLSEDAFPQRPVRWQVIHPAIGQAIQNLQQTIRLQPAALGFLGLGDLYRRLYDTAAEQAADRERFYAQALSAYADGLALAEVSGESSQTTARLHQALATLYRSRSIGKDGSVDPAYVELMVAEAETALASFPPDATAERDEVAGWLADGLRLQARQAQQRKDWPAALALLDRLAALPDSLVDPTRLAEERRLLLLEQSLQLLSQGHSEAALALAGPTLALGDLLPTADRQAIFARWEVNLTIRPDRLLLTSVAPALPGRQDEARRQVEQLALAWNALPLRSGTAQIGFDGKQCLITIDGLSLNERLALIQATPQNTHWALLRTLLVNADGVVETKGHLIWETTTMRYSVDLRPVADQWNGIGAGLERESQAMVRTGSSEERIRGELAAITQRQEAERWQTMAAESRVQIELADSARPEAGLRRVWSVQLTDPPQPLTLVSQSLALPRLLIFLVLAMALLFALAGILWLLL